MIFRDGGRRNRLLFRLNGETMKKFHDVRVTFHQRCPVCGRLLSIRVTLLGKQVFCQHCGGGFVATDVSCGAACERSQTRRIDELIQRADAMLQEAADAGDPPQPW